jgi:Na+-transporting NADH:ubiquinone oxidoreductase subunit NqrB
MLFQDARYYQIFFLCTFLLLGICTRDWTLRADLLVTVIFCCLLTQAFLSHLSKFVKKKEEPGLPAYQAQLQNYHSFSLLSIPGWQSAIITSLSLCLLLRSNDYKTMAIAGCLAIASKFCLCWRGKHFFNPANLGIIAALTLTGDAWVSPGQWGTDWWYLLLFLGTGGLILKRVGRWETSATFLLSYTALEAMRNFWLGWSWDVWQHQLMSGSLLIFALFMLTDPRSIPNRTISRLIWSLAIAGLTFILQHSFYFSTAMFWSLFFLSPLTIILDYIWIAPRFHWQFDRAKSLVLPPTEFSSTQLE